MRSCILCGQSHPALKGYVVQWQEHPGGKWNSVTRPTPKKETARHFRELIQGETRIFNVYTRMETH